MDILNAAKQLGIQYNVTFKVIDQLTGKVSQEHVGHNCATNSLLHGIAHHLVGDSIWNQGWYMLQHYVPQYISLGTMGLHSQSQDDDGLPLGIGPDSGDEASRFKTYMEQRPGYGSDGYDPNLINNRSYMGLGPTYDNRSYQETVECELISDKFYRFPITFRDIVPETQSELPKTIDVVFSALISTGALKQFRGDNDYIFITEAGLWSRKDWIDSGENGLLAAYRVAPPNENNWDMSESENREILRQNVLRVGVNQVVMVIWKLQLGSIDQFGGRGSDVPFPVAARVYETVARGNIAALDNVAATNISNNKSTLDNTAISTASNVPDSNTLLDAVADATSSSEINVSNAAYNNNTALSNESVLTEQQTNISPEGIDSVIGDSIDSLNSISTISVFGEILDNINNEEEQTNG